MPETVTNRVVCPASQREAQYNLKAAFPDFPDVLEQWRLATRRMRATLPSRDDIAYGVKPLQEFDFYPSTATLGKAGPLLVFIHGGYWQGGDKRDIGFIAAPYVAAGISVAVINYSLAPAVPMEAMLDELNSCLAALRQQAGTLRFDAQRIWLMGHSAGGHLAAMHAVSDHNVAHPVQGVVAISGLFDLEPLLGTSVNHALGLSRDRADLLSPVLRCGPPATEIHTVVGVDETRQFHDQSAVLAQCWPRQVLSHAVVPAAHHYTVLWALADGSNALTRRLIDRMHRTAAMSGS